MGAERASAAVVGHATASTNVPAMSPHAAVSQAPVARIPTSLTPARAACTAGLTVANPPWFRAARFAASQLATTAPASSPGCVER